jgi:UDP-GlcNAc:undecaprenyl-phosphate GlcNAc-1-phosphate transferase
MIEPAATTTLVALLLSLAATPLVRQLALRCGATDMPDTRRIHLRPTARGGGVAVAAAAAVAVAVGGALPPGLGGYVLAGGALLLTVGVIDDVFSMRAHTKLLAQVVAACLAVAGGLRLPFFGAAFDGALAVVDPALTVLWIVLVTNALNLSDGLDGLASGVGTIGFLALAAAALRRGDVATAIPALALAAALLGFLVYNFNPASIFLGDAGSLLIGYALAVLPLVGSAGTPMRPLGAFLLVALPVTDTLLTIARRFVSRCLRTWGEGRFWRGIADGLKNTICPDRRHIHHRLVDLGFSQRPAVLLLYTGAAGTAALAYLVAGAPGWPVDLFALGLGVAVIGLVRALGIDELQPSRSDLYLPVLRRLARRRWLLVVADCCLMAAAYGGALGLTGKPGMRAATVAVVITVMVSAQLGTFAALRVYRTTWWAAGVSGIGLLLRACGAGTISGYVALRLLELPAHGTTAVVYCLLLLPGLTMMRYSYVLLTLSVRSASSERALICGTLGDARQALRRLRRGGLRALEPVGFVEFSPRLQGRDLARLPVLGTLDGLAGIIRERQVKHLVIADPGLPGEALTWIRAVCQQLGVQVHRYVEELVPYDLLRPAGAEVVMAQNGAGNGSPDAWEAPQDVDAPRG